MADVGIDEYRAILDYVTPGQRRYVDALLAAEGDLDRVAAELQKNRDTVRRMLSKARETAAGRGIAPASDMTRPAAPGYVIKGTSTYYEATEDTPAQWVKTERGKAQRLEDFLDGFGAEAERFRGMMPLVELPDTGVLSDDLLAVYPIGDPHLGMRAWAPEAGANFDLQIAQNELDLFVDLTVDRAPPASTGVLLSLGDFFHAHDDTATTKRSGHALDVDGRTAKIFEAGCGVVKRAIMRALEKHERVIFRSLIGNHDDFLAMALAFCVREAFSENPRVTVDCDPSVWWWYEFGSVLLGGTHGHTAKPERMRDAMIVDQAAAWGRTRYRHLYAGHVHHNSRIDLAGVTVEYMRNTAPNDAYAAFGGYRSRRDLRVDTYHRHDGLIDSATVPRELVTRVLEMRAA